MPCNEQSLAKIRIFEQTPILSGVQKDFGLKKFFSPKNISSNKVLGPKKVFEQKYLTLSALGGAGPSIAWGGGQFDPHFLTAPRGLIGP